MTDLREVIEGLEADRQRHLAEADRIGAAIIALQPLAGEADPPQRRAKPAKRRKPRASKPVRKAAKAAKPVKAAKAGGKGLRARISDETIARIQQLDGQGKPRGEIAALCGVSAPTVAKYADMAPVKANGSNGAPPAPVGKIDPTTKRPWV